MRSLIFIISLLLLTQVLEAQQSALLPFKIEGTINADTGTVYLDVLFDKDYYPEGVESLQTRVENKSFSFTGNIPYPQGFTLNYNQGRPSEIIVVEPGLQTVTCSIDAHRITAEVENGAMKEFDTEYKQAMLPITQRMDRIGQKADSLYHIYDHELPYELKLALENDYKRSYTASDSTLLEYVKLHPNSYLAFWRFIKLFSFFGYENIFDPIYSHFSDSLKQTHTGQVLGSNLEIASKLAYGASFPAIKVVDTQDKPAELSFSPKSKYTFIDFWYSNCGPCIQQFPHLVKTYSNYKDRGFQIIGVSTDKLSYEAAWRRAIQKYQLTWPQYWDKEGIESSKLSINKFPTNYLLDEEGKIIRKDLRPTELEQFLIENL